MITSIIKKILYFFKPYRNYLNFHKSITNKVTLIQYITFWCRSDKRIYWPVSKFSEITHPDNIFVGYNSNPGTRPGCYIQGNGGVKIGNYVHFASNIGIISANHDFYNHDQHVRNAVEIGDYCWLGMGAIILPGVKLGPRTIVGAGSIVTHSFPDGFCVIGGNPARKIKELDPELFTPLDFGVKFYGFIPESNFKKFASKHLSDNSYINNTSSNQKIKD